jgi:hypothetical protein
MSSEHVHKVGGEDEKTPVTGPGESEQAADRVRREASFSRRGLLQWTVPAIVAVSLPSQTFAGSSHHDGHGDHHGDHHHDGPHP